MNSLEMQELMHYGVKGMKWRRRKQKTKKGKEPWVSDEYKEETEYNSRKNVYPENMYVQGESLADRKKRGQGSRANISRGSLNPSLIDAGVAWFKKNVWLKF